jgi:hypothetical protein
MKTGPDALGTAKNVYTILQKQKEKILNLAIAIFLLLNFIFLSGV